MLGVLVGSAALIIILSVFNGFENIILSMYTTLSPDIELSAAEGKRIRLDAGVAQQLKNDPRVVNYVEVLQEKAVIRYGNTQFIGKIKGVATSYTQAKALDSLVVDGQFVLEKEGEAYAVIGTGVQAHLSVNVGDEFQPLTLYAPQKTDENTVNPTNEFAVKSIFPVGVVQAQQETDDVVWVPLSFARDLLGEAQASSSIELSIAPHVDAENFKEELQRKVGESVMVKTRIQQNALLYKILNSEKWAIFLILTFVLIIAIFNIIGSLTMLVIDKRKDIAILSSMGASRTLIQRIFFLEGMMISGLGCVAGMGLALAFCVIQQKTGFIKMEEGNPFLEAYPIALKWTDFVLVTATVLGISVGASSISSKLSVKTLNQLKENL